ncbi:CdaR family protein [Bacillus sp. FJAT-50079]|uniref:CdaR family protein n=1 Tax=Bacillus sp. FJAT-50079 TaxID=2833577 RepID=UPI001BC8CF40|nr:CdaR family protein [Bacillus sp. FJAT-50079]MBS4210017.1 YbbR-like domain-containing protein [Bacillus sp. FJAT-50079]
MDKFMESPWFMRLIALLLALLLFFTANDLMNKESRTTPNGMESNDMDTITDVPLEIIYDTENLVVSGVPQSVDVKIEGQRRFVEATKRQRDFSVYIDLSDVEIGKHRVPILYKDVSEKLKVTIEPQYVDITLQERVTEEFKVEAEFNRGILAEGFEAEKPEIKPKTVKITGAKDVIDKVTYVKATIDTSGLINDTIKKEALVTVLDQDLNKLDVIVEPSSVLVTIPVTNPRKNVPVKINRTGTPPSDIEIITVSTNTPEVVIFGRTEILQSINEIEVNVDVSGITEDTEIEVPVKAPSGVNKLTPETITVKIVAEKKEQESTISDLSLESKGLDQGLDLEFVSPTDGIASITVTGLKEELEKINKDDLHVFFNAEGLGQGEHEVSLEVTGLGDLKYELSVKVAKIRLIEKEAV